MFEVTSLMQGQATLMNGLRDMLKTGSGKLV